jgi:hypothetical protein
MTTATRPTRPIAKPVGIIALCLILLLASGFAFQATGWVWLGFVNLILLTFGGLTAAWLAAVLVILGLAAVVGRRRR